MRVTLTGASGLIGTKLVRALRARGDDVTVLSRDPEQTSGALGVPAERGDPNTGPAPASALRRPRRDRPPRGRARRPALDRRVAARDRRIARDRHAQPRRRPARRPTRGPACSSSSSAVGYYGAARRRGRRGVRAARDRDFLARGVRRLGAPGRARRGARDARRARAHRRRARRRRRRARADATPFKLGVGGPVAGGDQYMPWIHVDDLVGIYLAAIDDAALDAGRSTPRRPSRSRTRCSRGRSGARCTGRRSCRSPASRCSCSTATWPRSSPRASAPCRAARSTSATPSATPTSTRRCATRSPS